MEFPLYMYFLLQWASDAHSVVSSHLEALELDSSVGGTTLPVDLAPENATAVYSQYNFSHNYDARLPISNFKDMVNILIEVKMRTYSGKKTNYSWFCTLTHFILNELFCHMYWKTPFSI